MSSGRFGRIALQSPHSGVAVKSLMFYGAHATVETLGMRLFIRDLLDSTYQEFPRNFMQIDFLDALFPLDYALLCHGMSKGESSGESVEDVRSAS